MKISSAVSEGKTTFVAQLNTMAQDNGEDAGAPVADFNPLNNEERLEPSTADSTTKEANPQAEILPGDSETTKAEKIERHGYAANDDFEDRTPKRRKVDIEPAVTAAEPTTERNGRVKGVAPIKKEYLIDISRTAQPAAHEDDDAAEASGKAESQPSGGRGGKKTQGGQNKGRQFGSSRDAIQLCKSRSLANEFTPSTCQYGKGCRYEHDIRKYLKDGKREDVQTFNGVCPVWQIKGKCSAGWRCRFAGSHSKEVEHDDGRKELVMLGTEQNEPNGHAEQEDEGLGVVNVVSNGCLLYTSPSPRDGLLSRMPSSA